MICRRFVEAQDKQNTHQNRKMNNLAERSEFKLKSPPQDAISTVRFMPGINSPLLLVSSWDSTVGLYDINSNVLKHRYTHNQRPVLDCAIKVG